MTIFLTSHIGGYSYQNGRRVPGPLLRENGLLEQLRRHWKENARVLLAAADPKDTQKSDDLRACYTAVFPENGLSLGSFTIWDCRNREAIQTLTEFDVLLLSGGHVPTQNAFFREIGLKEKLASFDGLVIGISAGTMNAAETVYAHPELDGEATDPDYQRFLPGLGLTKTMILPHFQSIRQDVLDGLRVIEDIAFPDSMGREFLCLPDGSYVICQEGLETIFGEAWIIRNGKIVPVRTDVQ